MGCFRGASKAYLEEENEENEQNEEKVDTNVIEIRFDDLIEKAQNIVTRQPITCTECLSILNKYSQLFESNKKNCNKLWVCEFCGNENHIKIEKEDIPNDEDVVYEVEEGNIAKNKKDRKTDIEIENNKDNSVIFCIDISGSMYQHKKPVVEAIQKQITEIYQESPNQKIGIITFSKEVEISGDCSKDSVKIKQPTIENQKQVQQISQKAANDLLQRKVKDQYDTLQTKIKRLDPEGSTALGPALLSSIEFAKKGKPGSLVILCTDGLANEGIGKIEGETDQDKAIKFYQEMGDYAAQNGIVISVITIKGAQCRLDILNYLADRTNGNVSRVNTKNIEASLKTIFKDQILATQTELIVKIHKGLRFRRESDKSSTLKKHIGNATSDTIFTCEYQLRSHKELVEMDIDPKNLKKIPFQVRTNYQNLVGDKFVWVTTHLVDTTDKIEEVEKEANLDVIQKRIVQQTVNNMEKGAKQTLKQNKKWSEYMETKLGKTKANKEKAEKFKKEQNSKLVKLVKKHGKKVENEDDFEEEEEEESQFKSKKDKKSKKVKGKSKILVEEAEIEMSEDEEFAEIQKFKKGKF